MENMSNEIHRSIDPGYTIRVGTKESLYKYYKDNLKVSKPLDREVGLYDMGDCLSIDKQFKTMETDSRPVWMILFLDKVSESEVKSVREYVYLLKE